MTLGPRIPPGERLRRAGVAAWSIIGILIVAAVFAWALMKVSVILPPLGLAMLIIYVLNPVVVRLESRGVRRSLGAVGAYVVVLGAFTLLVLLVAPLISQQVQGFSDDWPEFKLQIAGVVEGWAATIERRFGADVDTSQVTCLLGIEEGDVAGAPSVERCDEVTQSLRDALVDRADRLTELGSSLLELLLIFVLGPLIALYMLIDLPQLQRDLTNLVPARHRAEFQDVASKVGRAVGGFFRGQLVVAIIVGVLASAGFRLIGLPFWLLIGAIAGVTNLIPLVGPFIGGGLGVAVAIVSGGVALAVKTALVALVVQQLDNHVISPNVMKRTVNLHPVTVMLALLAGGTLAGFWGVLLGVPAVAVAKIVLGHLWATRVLGAQVSPFVPERDRPGEG